MNCEGGGGMRLVVFLSQNLPGRTEENHENVTQGRRPPSRESDPRPPVQETVVLVAHP